jgi:uncharacterized Fe-S center protein
VTETTGLGNLKDRCSANAIVDFLNFVIDVTPHCDRHPYSDNTIVPDLGIFVSNDIVAIDKASYDAIIKSNYKVVDGT